MELQGRWELQSAQFERQQSGLEFVAAPSVPGLCRSENQDHGQSQEDHPRDPAHELNYWIWSPFVPACLLGAGTCSWMTCGGLPVWTTSDHDGVPMDPVNIRKNGSSPSGTLLSFLKTRTCPRARDAWTGLWDVPLRTWKSVVHRSALRMRSVWSCRGVCDLVMRSAYHRDHTPPEAKDPPQAAHRNHGTCV